MSGFRYFHLLCLVTLASTVHAGDCSAAEQVETNDYKVIQTFVDEVIDRHQSDGVLVAFDIDNTMLKVNQDLGSEPWFDWQAEGLVAKTNTPNPTPGQFDYLVAPDFPGLVRAWTLLLTLSATSVTQAELPDVLAHMQNRGAATIVLTSRGNEQHDVTLRELNHNKLFFAKAAAAPQVGFAGAYLPYDQSQPQAMGFTEEEIAKYKLKEKTPKLVQYNQGVYLTEGQNKGVMLRALLARTKQSYGAIVYIDNMEKQTKAVTELIDGRSINGKTPELLTIRYNRIDSMATDFKAKDKSEVTKQWNDLQNLRISTFK